MIRYGIDTNVLVRYIVQDDKKQAAKATEFLERCCKVDSPGHISLLVLCELVWVLKRAYRYRKADIAKVLQTILSAIEFKVESSSIAWEALRLYEKNSADFSDYLIGKTNVITGCKKTVTFDKEAAKSELFELIKD